MVISLWVQEGQRHRQENLEEVKALARKPKETLTRYCGFMVLMQPQSTI